MDRLNALPRPDQFEEAQRRLDEARRQLVRDMSDEQAWADYLAALDEWQRAVSGGAVGKPQRGYVWSKKHEHPTHHH